MGAMDVIAYVAAFGAAFHAKAVVRFARTAATWVVRRLGA